MMVVSLQTTPALAQWLPPVSACAESVRNLGVYAEILPRTELNTNGTDLTLRLGERLDSDLFVSVMGNERLVIVAGEDVPVDLLSFESLQTLYTGTAKNWSDLPEAADLGLSETLPAVTLSYPRGNELEQFFSQIYLSNNPITGNAIRYSTIDKLESLLEQYPSAVAYTLESQIPAGVRTLAIRGMESNAELLVLAITPVEPSDGLRQLLLCLQDAQ